MLRPHFLPGLTASFDWYHIRISDAINTPTAQQVAELCVDSPMIGNQYCGQLNRDPTTGFLIGNDIINVKPENVAAFKTSGLDVDINYTLKTGRIGTFDFHVIGGYLHDLSYTYAVGAPAENQLNYLSGGPYGSDPYPKYNANLTTTWTKGPFSITYNLGWFGRTRRYERKTTDAKPDYVAPEYLFIEAYWQHDLEVSVNAGKMMTFYAGVTNLTNEKPDFASSDYPVSGVGRYVFAGVTVKTGKIFQILTGNAFAAWRRASSRVPVQGAQDAARNCGQRRGLESSKGGLRAAAQEWLPGPDSNRRPFD